MGELGRLELFNQPIDKRDCSMNVCHLAARTLCSYSQHATTLEGTVPDKPVLNQFSFAFLLPEINKYNIGIKIKIIDKGKNQVPSPSAFPFTFWMVIKTIPPNISTIITFKYRSILVALVYCDKAFSSVISFG